MGGVWKTNSVVSLPEEKNQFSQVVWQRILLYLAGAGVVLLYPLGSAWVPHHTDVTDAW